MSTFLNFSSLLCDLVFESKSFSIFFLFAATLKHLYLVCWLHAISKREPLKPKGNNTKYIFVGCLNRMRLLQKPKQWIYRYFSNWNDDEKVCSSLFLLEFLYACVSHLVIKKTHGHAKAIAPKNCSSKVWTTTLQMICEFRQRHTFWNSKEFVCLQARNNQTAEPVDYTKLLQEFKPDKDTLNESFWMASVRCEMRTKWETLQFVMNHEEWWICSNLICSQAKISIQMLQNMNTWKHSNC